MNGTVALLRSLNIGFAICSDQQPKVLGFPSSHERLPLSPLILLHGAQTPPVRIATHPEEDLSRFNVEARCLAWFKPGCQCPVDE